jgi:hypothetical protein
MYDELEQFAGGFFDEDFDLEYATPDDAIAAFPRLQGADAVRDLVSEIDHLLASPLTDDELNRLWIGTFGGRYNPKADGLTYREWFAHVRELLTRAKAD